jgi:hypothetical protein
MIMRVYHSKVFYHGLIFLSNAVTTLSLIIFLNGEIFVSQDLITTGLKPCIKDFITANYYCDGMAWRVMQYNKHAENKALVKIPLQRYSGSKLRLY